MESISDVERVVRYGQENPAVFGGVWLDGDRIQVAITTDHELHAAHVKRVLAEPHRVDVVPARWTLTHLHEVRAEVQRIVAAHPGMTRSTGLGPGRVTVELRADGEVVAADLHARFGGVLVLTVGGRPYPWRGDGHSAPEPPTATAPSEGLELWLRLDAGEVRSGHDLRGTLVVHNTAATPVLLTGSPTRPATVLDEHGDVAGIFAGWATDAGMHRLVEPDRIIYLRVLGGTAGTGTRATPPGRYRVVATLDVAEADGSGGRQLLSPPVPVRVLG